MDSFIYIYITKISETIQNPTLQSLKPKSLQNIKKLYNQTRVTKVDHIIRKIKIIFKYLP